MRQRRKFLKGLEIALPNAHQIQELIRRDRLYSIHNGPIAPNDMLLKLPNATVDLGTDTTRRSRHGDYISKIPTVSVSGYAMEGSDTDEPDDARPNRERAYAFLWPILAPAFGEEPHRYDFHRRAGNQEEENFTSPLQLLSILLEGCRLRGQSTQSPQEG